MTDAPDVVAPVAEGASATVSGWTFALLSTLAFSLSSPTSGLEPLPQSPEPYWQDLAGST